MPSTGRAPRRRRPRRTNTKMRRVARQEAKRVVQSSIESKSWDGILDYTGIDWSGAVYSLLKSPIAGTTISQGADDNQYIGNWIKPSYLIIRGVAVVADSTNLMRVVVLQVKGGGVPAPANVFQSVANIRAPFTPLERDYDQTFHVMADRLFTLDGVNMPQRTWKIKLSGKKFRKVFLSDAAGTIEANGIYIMFISDSGAVAHPTVSAQWRVHYKDA